MTNSSINHHTVPIAHRIYLSVRAPDGIEMGRVNVHIETSATSAEAWIEMANINNWLECSAQYIDIKRAFMEFFDDSFLLFVFMKEVM